MVVLPGEEYPFARNAERRGFARYVGSGRQGERRQQQQEKYKKEVERYEGDKEDISEKAKDLEKERDMVSRRADRFDGGEGLIEVGFVICSMTLLTKTPILLVRGNIDWSRRSRFRVDRFSGSAAANLPELFPLRTNTQRMVGPRRWLRATQADNFFHQLFQACEQFLVPKVVRGRLFADKG